MLAPVAGSAGPGGFSSETDPLIESFLRRPARVREEAMRRARACLEVKRLIDAGLSARAALAQAGRELGISPGTLSRWWFGHGLLPGVCDCPNVAAWPALLAPRWGEQAQRAAKMSPAAWYQILRDWLRPEKPALSAVYRRVASVAAGRGWVLPPYATVARRVKGLDPRLVVLAREGREAFDRLYPPLKRSVAHLQALEWVNADGHRLDVFVQLPERFGGGIGRPHLIAWQDVYSRKILAWRLAPTLNAYSVVLSFADLVTTWGIPDHALMDNGREFGAKAVTGGAPWRFRFKTSAEEMVGVLPLLGVTVHWATPFHGQAKPIERAFRDLSEEISKDPRLSGAYTGNKPDAKPENYGSRAADWRLVEQVVAEAIARHNAREGRRTETARGRSFDAAFAESFSRRVVRRLSPGQRGWLLLASEPVKVSSVNTFQLAGNTYGCAVEWGLAGKRIVARFDPDDLTKPPLVFTLEGALIGEAMARAVPFNDAHAPKALERWKAASRRAARQRLKAIEAIELIEQAQTPQAETPSPAATRLVQLAQPRQRDEAADAYVAGAERMVLEMSRKLAQG